MTRQDRRTRPGPDRASLYDEITDKIIGELEAGRLPWVQPWGAAAVKAPLAMPQNAATGRRYSGINVLILWGAVIEHGFPGQSWLTFRQALSLGGNVRKGERGTTVVYADRFTPEDEKRRARETGDEPDRIPFLKRFTVFNAAQCDGLPEEIAVAAPPPAPGLIEPRAEALIRATSIDFRIGGDRAFYMPSQDFVQVPPPQAYFEPINWHRTALHELGHYAVSWIMPHGRVRRPLRLLSAMRQFGIIRAFRGKRAAHRLGDNARYAFLGWQPARAPFPSAACRRGYRSGLFPRIRAQAIERSRIGRHHDAAIPSPCCAATCAA
ncbi:ArdC family protein [Rhizobium sp. X9]|uniref:ArdC family protein n=1 Tax=Rhizobium sp. X9 TaxID=2815360 RepID=UPI00345ED91A